MKRSKTVSPLLRFILQITGVLLWVLSLNMPLHAQTPSPNAPTSANAASVTGIKWLDRTLLVFSGIGGFAGGIGAIIATWKLIEQKDATIQQKDVVIEAINRELNRKNTEENVIIQAQNLIINDLNNRIDFFQNLPIAEELKKIIINTKGSVINLLRDKQNKLEKNEPNLPEDEKKELRKEIDELRSSLEKLAQIEERIYAEQSAAKWLEENAKNLAEDAASFIFKEKQENYVTFENSINAFLDWIVFNLEGGQFIPLDTLPPPIPSLIAKYKLAFNKIKEKIPQEMCVKPEGKLILLFLNDGEKWLEINKKN